MSSFSQWKRIATALIAVAAIVALARSDAQA
jgi:hypothetical protein